MVIFRSPENEKTRRSAALAARSSGRLSGCPCVKERCSWTAAVGVDDGVEADFRAEAVIFRRELHVAVAGLAQPVNDRGEGARHGVLFVGSDPPAKGIELVAQVILRWHRLSPCVVSVDKRRRS